MKMRMTAGLIALVCSLTANRNPLSRAHCVRKIGRHSGRRPSENSSRRSGDKPGSEGAARTRESSAGGHKRPGQCHKKETSGTISTPRPLACST